MKRFLEDSDVPRFVVVGLLNTAVDLAVLNILVLIFHVESAAGFFFVKSVSFLVAMINSFIFNRQFTFRDKKRITLRTVILFTAITLTSFGLNVLIATNLFVFLQAQLFGRNIAASLASIFGTLASMGTNYVGYKKIVFWIKDEDSEEN